MLLLIESFGSVLHIPVDLVRNNCWYVVVLDFLVSNITQFGSADLVTLPLFLTHGSRSLLVTIIPQVQLKCKTKSMNSCQ